ncbi:prepilin-type N-terminal cleavage/methylation domain-containing protein [Uliginosibacterium sediminicola]|uniref:Prepilin-type N-terminal cleavage/methylation domain-containing protein n=1 Tax=Uliginosibacterium sediminicola TaxID=2024550 RepID=A0ABU9YWA8_9RHOO
MMMRARGFSLIELLITLAILGFLLAAAIPSFHAWMSNSRVRLVADTLQNDLRKAQAEAVRRNHQTALILTASTSSLSALNATGSTTGGNWFMRVVNANSSESTSDATVGGSYFLGASTIGANYGVSMSASTAMVCFNSIGRPVTNSSAANLPSGGTYNLACTAPADAATPLTYTLSGATSSVRSLKVTVSLGGQIRMCDPAKTLSSSNPDGC